MAGGLAPSPSARAGGSDNYSDFQTHRGGSGASGLRRSLLRSTRSADAERAARFGTPFFLPFSLPCLHSLFLSPAAPHAPRQRVSAAAPRTREMALERLLSSRPLFFPLPPQLPGKASTDPPHPNETSPAHPLPHKRRAFRAFSHPQCFPSPPPCPSLTPRPPRRNAGNGRAPNAPLIYA